MTESLEVYELSVPPKEIATAPQEYAVEYDNRFLHLPDDGYKLPEGVIQRLKKVR